MADLSVADTAVADRPISSGKIRTGGTGSGGSRGARNVTSGGRASRYGLRTIALAYLTLILILPLGLITYRTFSSGIGKIFDALLKLFG